MLPAGTTGPSLMQALRGGGVTALVGVPRLYEALMGTIALRIGKRSAAAGAGRLAGSAEISHPIPAMDRVVVDGYR